MKKILLILFFVLAGVGNSFAQIPRTISYQADIRNDKGAPIADGNHVFGLSLYNTAVLGVPIYSETALTTVQNGIANIILGGYKQLPDSLLFDHTYYLGISIDGGAELTPRTIFTSVPYALHASVASGLTADAYIPPGLIIGSTAPSGPALGDLWGTYPYPQVVGLQTHPISPVLPQPGDVFMWNGGTWGPGKVPDPVAFHIGASSFGSSQINFNIFSGSTYFTDGNYFDSTWFNVPSTGVYRFDMNVDAITNFGSYDPNPQNVFVNVFMTVDDIKVNSKDYSKIVALDGNSSYLTVPVQYSTIIKLQSGQRVRFYAVYGDNNNGILSKSADLVGCKLK